MDGDGDGRGSLAAVSTAPQGSWLSDRVTIGSTVRIPRHRRRARSGPRLQSVHAGQQQPATLLAQKCIHNSVMETGTRKERAPATRNISILQTDLMA